MEALNLIATLIAIGSAAVTAAIWGWHRRPTSWGRPTLIFVSMGGTCRDPIAKAITDNLLAQKKPRIVVKAAGILKGHTRGASPAARNVVRERLGIDALAIMPLTTQVKRATGFATGRC